MDVLVLFTGEIHDIYRRHRDSGRRNRNRRAVRVRPFTHVRDGASDRLERPRPLALRPITVGGRGRTRRGGAIGNYSQISSDGDRWLYDIEFEPDTVDPFEIVLEEGGTVLSASASNGTWLLSVRVVDRERQFAVRSSRRQRRDADDRPTLRSGRGKPLSQCGLTARQYETLVAAIDHGYFEIPREVSMQELSEELGIFPSGALRAPAPRLPRARHVRTQRDRRGHRRTGDSDELNAFVSRRSRPTSDSMFSLAGDRRRVAHELNTHLEARTALTVTRAETTYHYYPSHTTRMT